MGPILPRFPEWGHLGSISSSSRQLLGWFPPCRPPAFCRKTPNNLFSEIPLLNNKMGCNQHRWETTAVCKFTFPGWRMPQGFLYLPFQVTFAQINATGRVLPPKSLIINMVFSVRFTLCFTDHAAQCNWPGRCTAPFFSTTEWLRQYFYVSRALT